jgi:hypothetical protein
MQNSILPFTGALLAGLVLSPHVASAQMNSVALGEQIGSYRDLHTKTAYGSLFFNRDAIRYSDSRALKRFEPIPSDGELDLPSQQGYCFAFNHFGSDHPNTAVSYQAKITKTFRTDPTNTEQIVERSFTATSDEPSGDLPDLCISRVNRLLRVEVEFSSSDTSLDWTIGFDVK